MYLLFALVALLFFFVRRYIGILTSVFSLRQKRQGHSFNQKKEKKKSSFLESRTHFMAAESLQLVVLVCIQLRCPCIPQVNYLVQEYNPASY